MTWVLETSVCTFTIRPIDHKFALYGQTPESGEELLQTASTPQALADNVCTQHSELDQWDDLEEPDESVTDSLSCWHFVK